MILARMMRFYRGGITPSEYDALTRTRHAHLLRIMNDTYGG